MKQTTRAALVVGVTALAGVGACQAVISEGSYFDPAGVVAIAQFSDLEGTPHELTLTPSGLFFVEGNGLYVVPADGSSPARLVESFSGAPTSLGYDGQDTLFACDPDGSVFALSASTTTPVAAPDAGSATCARVSASSATLAYLVVTDVGPEETAPDADVPIALTVLARDGGASESLKPHTETLFDVAFASQSSFVYGTLEGMLVRIGDPKINYGVAICRMMYVGHTDRPKIVPLPASDGGPLLLVRGGSDLIRSLDPVSSCCTAANDCAKPALPSVEPAQGDFTTVGPFVYWSDQNTVKRELITDVDQGANAVVVATISDTSASISEVAADPSAVYAAVGSRILRAPLPASPR